MILQKENEILMPLFAHPRTPDNNYADLVDDAPSDGFKLGGTNQVKLQRHTNTNFMCALGPNYNRPVTTVSNYGPSGAKRLSLMDEKIKYQPSGKGNTPFLLNGGPYHMWH
jgi:hypothetical protein